VETPRPNRVAGIKWLLGEYGATKDSVAGRRALERVLDTRRGAEEGEEFKGIRRGWCLEEETFRQELLAQMSERLGASITVGNEPRRRKRRPNGSLRRGWREGDLQRRLKGDAVKVALAARLRGETTLTGGMAERLVMSTRGHLNHLLCRRRKACRE